MDNLKAKMDTAKIISEEYGLKSYCEDSGGGMYCVFVELPGGEIAAIGDADETWHCGVTDADGCLIREVDLCLSVHWTDVEKLVESISFFVL